MEQDPQTGYGCLAREFLEYREQIPRLLRAAQWERLAESLLRLNRMAERAGYRELCLRAQALIDILGRRGAGRDFAGIQVQGLVQGLVDLLAHSEWREQHRQFDAATDSQWEKPISRDTPSSLSREVGV
ncbi:MAG: hypothetical protein RJB38_1353 [Pseudomonadota bacterium]